MKVKDLKEFLQEVDENLEVIAQDKDFNSFVIDDKYTGEVTFKGACNESGELLPDGNDEKYDVKMFLISII